MEPKLNYSLKKHNSWHIPSVGNEVYMPTSIEELSQIIKKIDDLGLWLGLGSNVLLPERITTPVIIL